MAARSYKALLVVLSFGLKAVHQKQSLFLEKGHLKGIKQFRECPVRKLHILTGRYHETGKHGENGAEAYAPTQSDGHHGVYCNSDGFDLILAHGYMSICLISRMRASQENLGHTFIFRNYR